MSPTKRIPRIVAATAMLLATAAPFAMAQPASPSELRTIRVTLGDAPRPAATEPESTATGPQLPEGWVILDGDMLMPGDIASRDCYVTNTWPGGVIPFQLANDLDPAVESEMMLAMNEWESLINVQFVPRTTQSDHIFIQNSTSPNYSNSAVGRSGGRQILNAWRTHTRRVFVHELGHALGFFHEQSRTDRDQYVTIQFDNISTDGCFGLPCWFNFTVETFSNTYGPYDFASIMHYKQCSFSQCGSDACDADPATCRTIEVLPPYAAQWQNEIGTASHPSFWDTRVMSFLYPEPNWRFIRDTGNDILNAGTFLSPWESFTQGYSLTPLGGTLWVLDGRTITGPRTLSRGVVIIAGRNPVLFR